LADLAMRELLRTRAKAIGVRTVFSAMVLKKYLKLIELSIDIDEEYIPAIKSNTKNLNT